ncbi:hypothetical protein R1flu_017782 [Riccia fluitans]|uniref:Uncharacterized protein n=1 Tax=Riccia fluitans TaxID=41844 RepID=A0ABD1ZHX7_9MARC
MTTTTMKRETCCRCPVSCSSHPLPHPRVSLPRDELRFTTSTIAVGLIIPSCKGLSVYHAPKLCTLCAAALAGRAMDSVALAGHWTPSATNRELYSARTGRQPKSKT